MDLGERHDVSERFPEVFAELHAEAEAMRARLGDSLQGRTGPEVRPPDRVDG